MGKVRKHAAVLLIAVFVVLCGVSAGVAVRVTITMIEKRNQMIDETAKSGEAPKTKPAGNIVKPAKLKSQAFYFNGRTVEGMTSYVTDKMQFLVPFDLLLSQLRIPFRYYGTDDLLETELDGKKLLVKLGKSNFRMGKEVVLLPEAPMAAREHILVPLELLRAVGGFTADTCPERETVFVNYHPDEAVETDLKLKTFRLVEGRLEVTDLSGTRAYLKKSGVGKATETVEFSEDQSVALWKTRDKVYVVRSKGSSVTRQEVKVAPKARLSLDGRHLYWTDEEQECVFMYSIAARSTRKLGDDFYRVLNNHGKAGYRAESSLLLSYREGKGYKRVIFGKSLEKAEYTLLERGGKVVVDGHASYSPDGRRVLFHDSNSGYFLANSDGTGLIPLGKPEYAYWLNNSKILASDEGSLRIYSRSSRKWTKAPAEGRLLGQAEDGAVFYILGSDLYVEKEGRERKVAILPWKCDAVYAKTADGPYIAISIEKDALFLMDGQEPRPIGIYSLLVKGMRKGELFVDTDASVSLSPGNVKFTVLQQEEAFVSLHIYEKGQKEGQKLVLNYRAGDPAQPVRMRLLWVSDARLLVYTEDRVWIMDLEGDVRIRERVEPKNSRIRDILR